MTESDDDITHEERAIYLVILGAMVPIVTITALTGGTFDGGSTLCLGLLVLAILGLFAMLVVQRRRLPRARMHKDAP